MGDQNADIWLAPADDRLAYWSPQPVDRTRTEVRLERFPAAVSALLAGQIGPLANLRSSSGCAVVLATDSPWVELRLARLRHHQMVPQSVALTVEHGGRTQVVDSGDLREREGDIAVRLPTGCERGGGRAVVWIWLPPISTAAIAGVTVAAGSSVAPVRLPAPRLLCLGDSLVQGFSCQSPLHPWPARLAHLTGMPAWNLGVGGIRIEAEAFRWALVHPWELIVVGLGSNQAWMARDSERTAELTAAFAAELAASTAPRVIWCLPPWKPCEDGKGPSEFMGLSLDAEAGQRFTRVRAIMQERLQAFAPRIEVVADVLPHDHRWYPDGLHPFAPGFARYAQALFKHVSGSPTVPATANRPAEQAV